MVEGGIYSVDSGDGTFGVVKVLKVEPGIVHVRVYKNKFSSRPSSINVGDLSLGTIKDPDGFGMGHLPISEKDFSGWQPALLAKTKLSDDELEGYRIWKDSGGGVFGR